MDDRLKILWLGGNHSRHLYYANSIQEKYKFSGGIIEVRENSLPTPPKNIPNLDRENFINHFNERERCEKKYFGVQDYPNCKLLEVNESELNSEKTNFFINEIKPNLVLIFGTGMIRAPIISSLPENTINLHLGLSPRYRGSATLFWPFYFLEPNYAGITFHYIINEPDAGDIIHQLTPNLEIGDGIHDVACKAVINAADDAVKLIDKFNQNKTFIKYKQKGTGKNFLTNDFKPEHLRMIYNVYNNNIVDHYIKGSLKCREPKLIRQFI